MLQITQLPNGNLELSVPDIQDQKDLLEDVQAGKFELALYADLLETYSCNGSYSSVNPEVYNLGLTSDPYILAEDVTIQDNGDTIVSGGLWHYPEYMIKSLVKELAEGRAVILRKFHDTGGKQETLQCI